MFLEGLKKLLPILLILAFAASFSFAAGSSESDANVIKIGFIGPLTGDSANYGIKCANAARLAINKINASGGINGKQLALIVENCQDTVDRAISSYEKLVYNNNVVALIGPVTTSSALAVALRCFEDGVVMITPSATHKDITAHGNWIYRTVPSDFLQAEVAAHYFYEVLGYRKIACLYAMSDYSQGLAKSVEENFTGLGGSVTTMQKCMVGDKDFRTQLGKIRSSAPEAIYIPNQTAELAQILEEAAQLGMNIPFLSSDGFSDSEIYNLAGPYTDGVIYIGPAQAEASAILADFQSEYGRAYNGESPDSFATNTYDAACILFDAIGRVFAKGGEMADVDTFRSMINDEVKATKDFQGANGRINFAPNGDMIASQGVYRVENQSPLYLGSFRVVNNAIVQVD